MLSPPRLRSLLWESGYQRHASPGWDFTTDPVFAAAPLTGTIQGMRSVCVFAGSSTGARPVYAEAATQVGTLLAQRGYHLVYGGGAIGAMRTVYEAVTAAGGAATGVIPREIAEHPDYGELAEKRLDDLRLTEGLHARKALMSELSEAFLALPGGLGTLEETAEVCTWGQLGLHTKPVGLLNTDGYWDGLLAQLDRAVEDGFLDEPTRAAVIVEADPASLLGKLEAAL